MKRSNNQLCLVTALIIGSACACSDYKQCNADSDCGAANEYCDSAAGVCVISPACADGLLRCSTGCCAVKSVTGGSYHTCALTTAGGLKCWGNNSNGQLGDGSSDNNRVNPVDVTGLAENVTAMAEGARHSCALTSAGGVKCWGDNGSGQLGDGSTNQHTTPVDVSGLTSGVKLVTAGNGYTCALTTAGGVKCWGNNSYGQLGDGTIVGRTTSFNVTGLTSGIASVTAGGKHACALTVGGGVKCWGNNTKGQLGDNSTNQRNTPVDVSDLASGVVAVSAGGQHTCAVLTSGALKCWGDNESNQLGDDSDTNRLTPIDVNDLASGVSAVEASTDHTCALTTAGGVKCWGGGYVGQVGDGTTIYRPTPVDVTGLTSGVSAITTGDLHTCAITAAGGVKCWGDNSEGQLGDGTISRHLTPFDAAQLNSGLASIAAGAYYSCAVTSQGGVKCWGRDDTSQLDQGFINIFPTPIDIGGLTSGVTKAALGYHHACVLTTTGGVKCWGNNYYGQIGDNSNTSRATPVDVANLTSGVSALANGSHHSCAIKEGSVLCWGRNDSEQLGNGSTTSSNVPVKASDNDIGEPVIAISAGYNHTCELGKSGLLACWGDDGSGQLGGSSLNNRTFLAVAAGCAHTCAITDDNGVKCWGGNDSGQLGDNTTTGRSAPVDVFGLTSGVAAITAGLYHACALTDAGGVKCWGDNSSGQLGDGTDIGRSAPVDVIGLSSGVVAISAGFDHTCALTTSGTVKCWGGNGNGQLGDTLATNRAVPVFVSSM